LRRALRAAAAALAAIALCAAGLALYDRAAPAPEPWLEAAGLEARFAVVGGHRLRFVRTGRGPSVVLVHGFGSSLYTWKDVIAGLAADHDVVALDLPGFGLSDRPPDLSIEELPRAVVGLMDRLEIRSAALVGSSMGGAAVAIVAGRRPERASALVLVDAAGFHLGPGERPFFVRLAMSPLGGLLSRLPGQRLFVELALRDVLREPRLLTDERVAEYLQGTRQPGSPAAIRSLGASLEERYGAVEDALPGVRAPALVVWGRDDGWIPVADAERFRAAIAGARLVTIAGCGHLPQEQKPQELLRVLLEFLSSVGL
jgi:pimeloyl-ACP methyl ester carboxylesterase